MLGGKDNEMFINVSEANEESGRTNSEGEAASKPVSALTFCDSTISSIIRKCWA